MKLFLLLVITVLGTVNTFSQVPQIQWQKAFGGSGSDQANSIQKTTDGGFILAGHSSSTDGDVTGNQGMRDYWIVKTDASGNLVWQKSLGGSADDTANSIQQTSDGGYIVAGISSSNDGDVTGHHGNTDFWIVKLDVSGNLVWQKSLGGSGDDFARSIKQTTDGGYIVAGDSNSNDGDVAVNYGQTDYFIVKLDATGGLVWKSAMNSNTLYQGTTYVNQTTDGSPLIAGFTHNGGSPFGAYIYSSVIKKTDASGNLLWQTGFNDKPIYSIQQTADDGFIAAGNTLYYQLNNDPPIYPSFFIAKMNALGTTVWQKTLGGQATWNNTGSDYAKSIQQTTNGEYIIAGYSDAVNGNVTGNHGGYDYWIVKLDASGNLVWQKCLGGSGNDYANGILQTTDGGYVVAGYSNSINGDVIGNHGNTDFWIVKLAPDNLSAFEFEFEQQITLFPNPAGDQFSIQTNQNLEIQSIKIYNLLGQEIQTINKPGNTIDVSFLQSGNYIIKVATDLGISTNRFVKK